MNDQPTPTEKSQIVINWTYQAPSLVTRFNSVKKGDKEFAVLKKAWTTYVAATADTWDPKKYKRLHDMNGDMFITTIDLKYIAAINFIDHNKRAKFVPIP